MADGNMKKRVKLTEVKQAIDDCTSFLKTYLALANAHAVDFVIDNLWDKYIPPYIGSELMKLDEKEICEIPIKALHTSQNFGTEDTCTASSDSHNVETKQNYSSETCRNPNLDSFIKHCIKHSFDGGLRKLLTTKQGMFEADVGLDRKEQLLGRDLMSEKKSHEVDILANLCASLANKHDCKLVVDVGSGKGYLGTHLSSRYSLQTLSIDSSTNNTKSAINRADNLQKKRSKSRLKTGNEVFNTFCPVEHVESAIETAHLKRSEPAGCVPQGMVASGHFKKTDSTQIEQPDLPILTNWVSSDFMPITHLVTPETNFLELIRKVTLKDNVEACKGTDESTRILLTGLHTCGDLASSILKIFSTSPEIHVICTVGCCYNLLTEEIFPAECDNLDTSEVGFPLSSYLKQVSLRLGKGARNLAAQSIHRISACKTLQGKTFFDRALLEKIVVDLTGYRPSGQVNLRNLKKRSRSHYDYIYKAFIKLGLSTEKLTPELVDEYLLIYQKEEFKMAAFFQLRTLMAPCIETLILLDRACYLLELDSVQSVDIVQLFDPYTSPRCYGLIAIKSRGTDAIKYGCGSDNVQ